MTPGLLDQLRILPEIVLMLFAIWLMLAEAFGKVDSRRHGRGVIAFLGALSAIAASFVSAAHPGQAFHGMVVNDAFTLAFRLIVYSATAVVVLTSIEYLDRQMLWYGEWHALILLGAAGMGMLAAANDLIMIFIALETSSIASYLLAAWRRNAAESSEAGLKYFLLGSFASAFLLYGMALLFGVAGATNLQAIASELGRNAPLLARVATALVLVGLGFKLSAAPFHLWTPDVYEGAPAPASALLSTGPKVAALAALMHLLLAARAPGWFWPLWAMACLTMTVGNLGALLQTNVKRMLAYSSIAHAGALLLALCAAAGHGEGAAAAIFYAAGYAAANLGAFAVVGHLAGRRERYQTLTDYAGLARRRPGMAFLLTLFLLSLMGLPLTAGFFAKFYAFSAAVASGMNWLAVIGVANSVLAAVYYLRLILAMFAGEAIAERKHDEPAWGTRLAIAAAAVATLTLGLWPTPMLELARAAARTLAQ